MGATLGTVQALLIEKREKWFSGPPAAPTTPAISRPDSKTQSTEEWLQAHSLKAKKLSFQDALRPHVFRHAVGDVDILKRDSTTPTDGSDLLDAMAPGALHVKYVRRGLSDCVDNHFKSNHDHKACFIHVFSCSNSVCSFSGLFILLSLIYLMTSTTIDARVCEELTHYRWHDDTIVHLFLTDFVKVRLDCCSL